MYPNLSTVLLVTSVDCFSSKSNEELNQSNSELQGKLQAKVGFLVVCEDALRES